MSGINHVRYDHCSRPTLLHLTCPKCKSRCIASKPSESEKGVLTGNCNKAWMTDDWKLICERCSYRASGLAYEDLPSSYYQVEARGHILWAWNRDHLIMLLKLLKNELVQGDPYEWFATYTHGKWLQKKNRNYLAKSIERLLTNEMNST